MKDSGAPLARDTHSGMPLALGGGGYEDSSNLRVLFRTAANARLEHPARDAIKS